MRVLTVSEFSQWHRETKPETYIYATENQRDHGKSNASAVLRLPQMIASPPLRRLCFCSATNSLAFNRVKEVHLFDDMESIGTAFEIVCDSGPHYRMLAD